MISKTCKRKPFNPANISKKVRQTTLGYALEVTNLHPIDIEQATGVSETAIKYLISGRRDTCSVTTFVRIFNWLTKTRREKYKMEDFIDAKGLR